MQASKKFASKIQQTLLLLPALQLIWQSSPSWTSTRIILLVIQGILPLISIYLAKKIVDTVTMSLTTANKSASFEQAVILIAVMGGVTVFSTLCQSFAEVVNTAHSQKVVDHIQNLIHAKSAACEIEYYENSQYHDTLQRAQQEAPYRPPFILNRLGEVCQNGISLLGMIGLLLSLHWGIVGVLFVTAFPAMLVRMKYSRKIYNWQRKRTSIERQADYLSWILTNEQYAKEVRLFNLGSYLSQWYLRLRSHLYKENLKILTSKSTANFCVGAVAGIFIIAVYVFIIRQSIFGSLRLGDLVLYHQALQRGQNDIKSVLSSLSGLYEDNLFLTNFYELLNLKPKIIDPLNPTPIPQPIHRGIVFHNVSFNYSNTSRQTLKDINLTIRPGEVVALVGENGSGKTTLTKLLCRLYDPTEGNITIDGVDLRDFKIADLRRQISVIFQDYAKYHFTAQENIWLANIDLPPERESIINAARRSGADDVISKLPQGYDTVLGKLFDRGEELSIGQWQKIALARAFLRDSQLIVLDEPTSAMDPKAEYEVFEGFRQLIKNQAAILISHRLSTVKMADRIYVMSGGSIVESGTHEELINLNGNYAFLFETQAQHYR